jgi:hypothetical protein
MELIVGKNSISPRVTITIVPITQTKLLNQLREK